MTEHLSCSFALVENDVNGIERQLIKDLKPPLNLKGWKNPQRQRLRTLRAICREEARSVGKKQ